MEVKKPVSYVGTEPYIFISYAHKDKARVYPIIEGLQRRGLRVWYDEGIPGGKRYSKELADRVIKSEYMLAFISRSSLNSEFCTYEIDFAHDKKKGLIFVYLEDVPLPDEMAFMYGRLQAFYLSECGSLDGLLEKIVRTEELRPCRGLSQQATRKQNASGEMRRQDSTPPVVRSASVRKSSSSGKGKFVAIAAAAVAVLALVLVLVIPKLGNDNPNFDGTGGSTDAPLPKDPTERYQLALEYIQQEKYLEAYEILGEMTDHSDAASQMKAIREKAFLQQIQKANPGDIVYWGSYEQDTVNSNGKEDIAWVVLYDDSGRKLLLSQQCLDSQPYNEQNTPTSWAKCTLRTWLNDDFYWEAFNEAEQEALHYALIETEGSEATRDYVCLLSMAEASLYLDLFENRLFSEYSIRQGAGQNLQQWWLRDTHNGAYNFGATCYGDNKVVADLGEQIYRDGVGVRPAIWIDTRTEAEKEAEYTAALSLFEKANYKKALPAFEALGDYKDSLDYCQRLPKLIILKPYMEAEVGDEVRVGNYDWIVLEKQDDKILVVSKYSVSLAPYRRDGVNKTWNVSDLRDWLNGQFMNHMLMPGDEKALILPTKVSIPANPEYGTTNGPDVTDRIFILSYEEVMQYFPNAKDRVLTTAEDTITGVVWWTCTAGKDQDNIVCVDQFGEIQLEGNPSHIFVFTAHARPAMWISTAE
jgi:hypothetical protein